MFSSAEREIELKLEAAPDVLARVRRSRLLSGIADDRAKTATIETTYFDSLDHRLAKKGIALRIRKAGRKFQQTAKSSGSNGNGAAQARMEWSADVAGLSPEPGLIGDPQIRKRVEKLAGENELAPYCTTKMRRTTRNLTTEQGDRIELAFDVGHIELPDGRIVDDAAISEMELELKIGSASSLVELARRIAEEFPVRLALRTKSQRGLDLATGTRFRPKKAGDIELDPEISVSAGFAAILTHCLAHAIANEDAILHAHDPEGIHQMRVALRRLRSAMAAFGKPLQTPEMKRLRAEIKWLADLLGRTRDYDVFIAETLAPLIKDRPDDQRLRKFARVVRARNKEAWAQTIEALQSTRYRLLMIDLGCAVACESWRSDITDPAAAAILAGTLVSHARTVLNKRAAKTRQFGERIDALDNPERHELRIELKKLRYAGEFFEAVFPPKATRNYLKKVSELQEIFGYLNDAAVAEHIVNRTLEGAKETEQTALAFAGGLVTGWHAVRVNDVWGRAKDRWKTLEKATPFWTNES